MQQVQPKCCWEQKIKTQFHRTWFNLCGNKNPSVPSAGDQTPSCQSRWYCPVSLQVRQHLLFYLTLFVFFHICYCTPFFVFLLSTFAVSEFLYFLRNLNNWSADSYMFGFFSRMFLCVSWLISHFVLNTFWSCILNTSLFFQVVKIFVVFDDLYFVHFEKWQTSRKMVLRKMIFLCIFLPLFCLLLRMVLMQYTYVFLWSIYLS